jgi:hypothetical protein
MDSTTPTTAGFSVLALAVQDRARKRKAGGALAVPSRAAIPEEMIQRLRLMATESQDEDTSNFLHECADWMESTK